MGSSRDEPHRVLGVPRDASEAEVRRAYRALAKRHHPDGGRGSIARFLEIQAAYEALAGGDRPGAESRPAASRPAPRPGPDWTRRARPTASRRRDPGPAPNEPRAASPPPAADPGRDRRDLGGRRATLGSTSYDGAEDAFEPGWGGASWYGPSSGTYWTLNPREYADPRKHGPEYQARARRPAATGSPTGPDAADQPGQATAVPAARTAAAPAPPARPGVVTMILDRWRRGRMRP
ncbi:MAG TPA: DnaJ domain-containing protein [Patescibacteria group bacterium]|nr:DnaJ domain-containing protein [Patescibacteria group bacterium]